MRHSIATRSKSGFTLIELLVVIAIIAVLAGAGFAGVNFAINKARQLSAQATATAIEQAINAYYSEYGGFPSENAKVNTANDTQFLQALLGEDENLNPKGTRFLSVKEGRERGAGGRDGLVYVGTGNTIKGLYDPWGNGFSVELDVNFEERLTFTTADNQSVTLRGRRAAVHSPGVEEGEKSSNNTIVRTW